MKREIKFDDSKLHYALNMTSNEKYISFLNRFFIFKKMTDVNTEDLYNSYFLSEMSEPPPEEPTLLPEPTEDLFTDLGREETSIPNILPGEEKEVENEIVIEPLSEPVEKVIEPPQPIKRKTAVPRVPKEPKVPKEKVVKEPKPVKEPKEKVPRKTTTRKVKKNEEETKEEK